MIIFGWGGGKPKDLGPALPLECPQCGREGFARYFTVTKWFRLYFIPVLPYQTKHFLICPVCTAARELSGPERQVVERMVGLTAAFLSGATSEDRYQALLAAELSGDARVALPAVTSEANEPATPPRPDSTAIPTDTISVREGTAWSG